jgi:hypothetical protein
MIHIDSNFCHIKEQIDNYVDALHTSPRNQFICTKTGTHLVNQAILHHGCIQRKLTAWRKEQPFLPDQILIGNLPPTDLFFPNSCPFLPMLAHPTPHQGQGAMYHSTPLKLAGMDVVCKALIERALIMYHDGKIMTGIDDHNHSFQKYLHEPLPTNSVNYSIDFLTHLEYYQYNVIKSVDKKDPFIWFGRNTKKVIVYQGNPLYCTTYTAATTPTECAIPGENAHKYPITYTEEQRPMNYNYENQE